MIKKNVYNLQTENNIQIRNLGPEEFVTIKYSVNHISKLFKYETEDGIKHK